MTTPQVPPRPTRSQPSPSTTSTPQVPPRPAGRRIERSQSPSRYAQSPLNEIPFNAPAGGPYGHHKHSTSQTSLDIPVRPPSVSLPSLGQEGNEYGDLEIVESHPLQKTVSGNTHTTSHVGHDLPLHAPKPSFSSSDQKARIAQVTRTTSNQAVAAGIGKPPTQENDDRDPYNRPLKSKSSSGFVRSTSSLSTDRPGSAMDEEEHGIPHIGQHVPLLLNAGDVQAPSPAPFPLVHASASPHSEKPRHHARTRSGKEIFHGPPGSYGLHGHGVAPTDRFEKAWYEKHPEEAAHEQGHYGPALSENRHAWALSKEDLNKIVDSSSNSSGFATSANVVGLPDEQIGYLASDEYTSRMNSPRPQNYANKAHSNSSQTNIESPLRKASFPHDMLEKSIAASKAAPKAPSSQGDDDPIHVDLPEERWTKIGKEGHLPSDQIRDHASHLEDHSYGAPILASDQVRQGQEHLLPAVSPAPLSRRGSVQDDYIHLHRTTSAGNSRPGSRPASRPGSRPGSIHGFPHLVRSVSHDQETGAHTPLENVEEYEPLFPDDDEETKRAKIEKNKQLKHRPDVIKKFPSKDIWEDEPASRMLETEVDTSEPEHDEISQPARSAFESPDAEAARKGEVSESDRSRMLSKEERLAGSGFKVRQRPKARHFPSQDIWEDSPDSARLETTVDLEEDDAESPPNTSLDAGSVVPIATTAREGATVGQPIVPPRPSRSKDGADSEPPLVPARPSKKTSSDSPEGASSTDTKRPVVPDRPKPYIPPRANKLSSQDSASSGEGAKAPPPATKPKPTIPARPAGGKIAALQAGFMADLNSRLKVGPQSHPKQVDEPKEEATEVPTDARKGRARGPAKRRPGASSGSSEKKSQPHLSFSISSPWTVFSTSLEGILEVPAAEAAAEDSKESDNLHVHEVVPAITTNKARESVAPSDDLSASTHQHPDNGPHAQTVPMAIDSARIDMTLQEETASLPQGLDVEPHAADLAKDRHVEADAAVSDKAVNEHIEILKIAGKEDRKKAIDADKGEE